ncbi:hypothetical protein [Aquamicrobium ahrensii]|uniref:Uncharacterized protein n=1 Tax=Aquamicrobium ahrensii TaxID=469551 RepID=A0ABV2KQK2_9HYPH
MGEIEESNWVGRVLIKVGTPVASTLAWIADLVSPSPDASGQAPAKLAADATIDKGTASKEKQELCPTLDGGCHNQETSQAE